MKFSIFLSFTLSFHLVFASAKRKPAQTDLRAKEEFIFYSKKDMSLSEIGKIDEYQGVLILSNQAHYEFRATDLYVFSNEDKISMSLELCRRSTDKIYGEDNKRSLKLVDEPLLFQTSVGQACLLRLKDTFKQAHRPFRFVMMGFVHGRLTALTWNLSKDASPAATIQLQNFWKSLK